MTLRLVSLEPSVTSILHTLGQMDKVVAVSHYCDQLVNVGQRPRLPSTWAIKPEDAIPLEPDLIIASAPFSTESVANLLKAQLDVLCLYPQRLDDVFRQVRLLGSLTDAAAAATSVVAHMQIQLEAIRQRVEGRPRPRVYVEMWPKPAMCSPLWVKELVEISGGNWCLEGDCGRKANTEEMIAADPEIILVAWAGIPEPDLAQIYRREGWEQITAVRCGRILAVPEILLNAPGVNLVQGAQVIAAALHPQLFDGQ